MKGIGTKKIAFVGTSCTGKTTLVEEYKKRFRGNHKGVVVDEAARSFFSQNPHIRDRFSTAVQGQIQNLALNNEKAAQLSGSPIIICDRSVLDAVAYARAYRDTKGAKILFEGIRHWIPTYNWIFLLNPADIPYQQDAIRTESEKERQEFHVAFMELFRETGVAYELLSGTVEQRIAQVDTVLG